MTVAELIYVGGVTALGRREGWSIHTGILHASPRRKRTGDENATADPHPRNPLEGDAGAELVGGEGEEEDGEARGRGRRRRAAAARPGTRAGARRWRAAGRSRPRRRRGSSRRPRQVQTRSQATAAPKSDERRHPHRALVDSGEAGEGDRDRQVARPPLVFPGEPEGVQPVPAERRGSRRPRSTTAAASRPERRAGRWAENPDMAGFRPIDVDVAQGVRRRRRGRRRGTRT